MAIYPDKSKCMLTATKQKLNRGSTLHWKIGNTHIENVEAQKLLGIYIDNTLSWTHQVSYIRKRVNSKIALLKRLSYYITHDMKVMFYNAYIHSTFDYCCPIWGSSKKRKLLLKSLKNE